MLTRPIEAMFSSKQQCILSSKVLRTAGFTASELLDPVFGDVKSVVEGLESGTIPAPLGYVVMYSESKQKHILLYSKAAQTTAFMHFDLHGSEGESDEDLAKRLGFLDVSQARSRSRSRSRSPSRTKKNITKPKKERVWLPDDQWQPVMQPCGEQWPDYFTVNCGGDLEQFSVRRGEVAWCYWQGDYYRIRGGDDGWTKSI